MSNERRFYLLLPTIQNLRPTGDVVYVDSTYFLEMFMEIYVEILWANRRVKRTEENACVVNTASP